MVMILVTIAATRLLLVCFWSATGLLMIMMSCCGCGAGGGGGGDDDSVGDVCGSGVWA